MNPIVILSCQPFSLKGRQLLLRTRLYYDYGRPIKNVYFNGCDYIIKTIKF